MDYLVFKKEQIMTKYRRLNDDCDFGGVNTLIDFFMYME